MPSLARPGRGRMYNDEPPLRSNDRDREPARALARAQTSDCCRRRVYYNKIKKKTNFKSKSYIIMVSIK